MPRASRPVTGVVSRLIEGWLPSTRTSVSEQTVGDESRRSERVFDRVVALQRADGSWELDEALLIACRLAPGQMPTLEALVPAATPLEGKRAMATAIALTFLRRRALADQAEWALLAGKAERYLDRVAVVPNCGGTWLDVASAMFA